MRVLSANDDSFVASNGRDFQTESQRPQIAAKRRDAHVLATFKARQLALVDLYPSRHIVLGHPERFANRPQPELLAKFSGPDTHLRFLLGAEPPISDVLPVVKLHGSVATTSVGTTRL